MNVHENIENFAKQFEDIASEMASEMEKPFIPDSNSPTFSDGNAAAIRRVSEAISENITRLSDLAAKVHTFTEDLRLTFTAYNAALNVLTTPERGGKPIVDGVIGSKKRATLPKASGDYADGE